MDSFPRGRSVAWLLLLALVALACARDSDPVATSSAPATAVDGSAALFPTYELPTQAARTATATATPALAQGFTRYLKRCAGTVCELSDQSEARLTPPPGTNENWSPDFTRLVSELIGAATAQPPPASPGDKPSLLESRFLWVRDVDGGWLMVGEVRRAERQAPAVWSPDGTLLAVSSPLAGEGIGVAESIEIVRADGSGGWTLVEGRDRSSGAFRTNLSPSWSPDGSEVAFIKASGQQPPESDEGLFIASADASSVRQVRLNGAWPIRVAWLPGGQLGLLAFVPPDRPRPPINPGPPPELFVVNPDGTGLRRLTEGGAYVDGDGRRPLVVSADGRCIAYRTTNYEELVGELSVTCLDGRTSRITRDRIGQPPAPGLSAHYTWLTDGRLAVLSPTECAGLLAVRVETEERDCIVY